MDEDTLRIMIADNLFVDEDITQILDNYETRQKVEIAITKLTAIQKLAGIEDLLLALLPQRNSSKVSKK